MIRKFLPWLGIGVALVAAYYSFDWAVGAVIHSKQVVMVPDLTGKSVAEALDLLAQPHLGLQKEDVQFDKRYPAGTIIRQVPMAGMMVREGRIVRATVSQGGETLFVPNLSGQPLRNAQTALQNAGLGIGEIERRPSLKYEKDLVMSSDPPGGAVIAKNGLVSILVSDGPPGSDVLLAPDFVGKTISKAKEWATSHQVTVSQREEADISRQEDEILMQSPTADSPIRPGDTLTLVVNHPSGAAVSQGPRIHFDVPQGASDRDIRILVVDEAGEHEVFRKAQAPGSRVDFHVLPKGRARARIFVNGVMVEEQELRP